MSKKKIILGLILLLIFASVMSGIGSLVAGLTYQRDLPIAKVGVQHLQKAETYLVHLQKSPFDANSVTQAQQEFAAAEQSFMQVDRDLRFVPEAASNLPGYGDRIHAALHLLPLALALSQAGVTGCNLLKFLMARFHNPLNGQAGGISLADLATIGQNIQAFKPLLSIIINEANQLQLADLQFDPRIGKLVTAVRENGPMIQQRLEGVEKMLPVAPELLGVGAPTNYLVEILDVTELRPGGGFIGNYGTATFKGGALGDAHITDTDLLDRPFAAAGGVIQLPAKYHWFDLALTNWSLRDSNLDADFPKNARNAETNYSKEGGRVPLQGVIAITPALIQQAFAITGPIVVSEYHETVNAQNLIARIHYHQLGAEEGPDTIAAPGGHSSLRKRFTELLAEHFLARMRQVFPSHIVQFLQIFASSVQTKDIQLYFNDLAAESLLHNSQLDASLLASPGDSLFVVDANIAANKANAFIKNTLTDNVTIEANGDAIHHAMLRYAWTIPGKNYGHYLYRDYVQVYVPAGSELLGQHGWQMRGSSEIPGYKVWAGFFTLVRGQTNTVTLAWRVPHASTKTSRGWQYKSLMQRQSGVLWQVDEQTALPLCASVKNVSGGMKIVNSREIILNQLLTENKIYTVDYIC